MDTLGAHYICVCVFHAVAAHTFRGWDAAGAPLGYIIKSSQGLWRAWMTCFRQSLWTWIGFTYIVHCAWRSPRGAFGAMWFDREIDEWCSINKSYKQMWLSTAGREPEGCLNFCVRMPSPKGKWQFFNAKFLHLPWSNITLKNTAEDDFQCKLAKAFAGRGRHNSSTVSVTASVMVPGGEWFDRSRWTKTSGYYTRCFSHSWF